MQFDQEKHILLCDQAHKRRIDDQTPEFQDYVEKIRNYPYLLSDETKRMQIFQVNVPSWPPIKRTPLQILFGLGGEADDPFYQRPWIGNKLVVFRDFWTQRATSIVAKQMVPNGQEFEQNRLAYQWQVKKFDPQKHVVIRTWCEQLKIDIADFWIDFFPSIENSVTIIETTNPTIKDELSGGGFVPYRRCALKKELYLIRDSYYEHRDRVSHVRPLITQRATQEKDRSIPTPKNLRAQILDNKVALSWNFANGVELSEIKGHQILVRTPDTDPPGEFRVFFETKDPLTAFDVSTLIPDTTYVFRVKMRLNDKRLSRWSNFVKVKTNKLKVNPVPEIIPDNDEDNDNEEVHPHDGAKVYSPSQVLHALEMSLGRDFNLFGKSTSDTKIVAMKRKAMVSFLKEDTTDKFVYVPDKGGQNFDCDNFADALRSSLQTKYGMNGVGIIWGDHHAWCFFVLVGKIRQDGLDTGPRIVFIEPQDDYIVEKLNGQFSINRRCEVYL